MMDPMTRFILKQRNQADHNKQRVIEAATTLRDRMDAVIRQCQKGDPLLNDLGEVQNLGGFVDAAVARYVAARDALDDACAFATDDGAARLSVARPEEDT